MLKAIQSHGCVFICWDKSSHLTLTYKANQHISQYRNPIQSYSLMGLTAPFLPDGRYRVFFFTVHLEAQRTQSHSGFVLLIKTSVPTFSLQQWTYL